MVSYKRLNCLPKEVGGRGSIGSNVLGFCLFKKNGLQGMQKHKMTIHVNITS
jgi:hypothetical protein